MTAIVCVDENWGIGKDNKLLFHIREDMERFKSLTKGAAVIYGQKTLESLPEGKPLEGRRNIVLTENENTISKEAEMFADEVYVLKYIGGRIFCVESPNNKYLKCIENKKHTVLIEAVNIKPKDVLKIQDWLDTNLCVIGGGYVYKELLPYCKDAMVTKVYEKREADAFFPDLDKENSGWKIDDSTHFPRVGTVFQSRTGIKFSFLRYLNENYTESTVTE